MTKPAFILVLALFSPVSTACSFAQPIPVEFNAALAKAGDTSPLPPVVTVESITRGNGSDSSDSCSDTGIVVLSIPATHKNKDFAYSFEIISGSADDVIF